jgi:hypothetical protein
MQDMHAIKGVCQKTIIDTHIILKKGVYDMIHSQYVEDLMTRLNDKAIKDEECYYEDIYANWMDKDLKISLDDACEAKDSGSLTPEKFKDLVREYRFKGGRGSPMDYIFEGIIDEDDELEFQEKSQPSLMDRSGYCVRDFI